MSNKTINLPNGVEGHRMKKNVDSISFKVTADCNFCYSDPTPCFPSFMPAGNYTATNPPTTYGPYTPNQAGTVVYNASVPPTPCSLTGIKGTACSITVDS
jgi:hypothetical protein